jgi:hypothetical protein
MGSIKGESSRAAGTLTRRRAGVSPSVFPHLKSLSPRPTVPLLPRYRSLAPPIGTASNFFSRNG